jgi:hypothetical protein
MAESSAAEIESLKGILQPRALADQAIRALSEQSAETASDKSATKAVALLMLHFGVDVDDPQQLRDFKENLQFLARAARGAGVVKNTAVKTCVGALVTGFLAILFLGLKDWLASLVVHH